MNCKCRIDWIYRDIDKCSLCETAPDLLLALMKYKSLFANFGKEIIAQDQASNFYLKDTISFADEVIAKAKGQS